jgi:PadR family transcriptional regulator, regulatory protein PadR
VIPPFTRSSSTSTDPGCPASLSRAFCGTGRGLRVSVQPSRFGKAGNSTCGLLPKTRVSPARRGISRAAEPTVTADPARLFVQHPPADSSPTPVFKRGRCTAHIDNQPTIHYIVIQMIGEFEYLILTSAARLDRDAYGASIRSEVELATGRPCSIGALYTTLDRLEAKGLVKTWMGDPTPQRGGRSKRLVQVTAAGAKQASDFFWVIARISKGVSWTTHASTRS